jgi:putative SOS response-associated peptidase YedK
MCNDYEQHIRWAQYCAMMQAAELGIPTKQSASDLPRADDIRINDTGPVMRAAGNVIELAPMNFSSPPTGRGGPVFNFKSEGRHFDKSNRCLIPASAFFEFTGKKYPKAKHRFTLNGAPFLAIAGIWREGKWDAPPAFTMLTTSPGPMWSLTIPGKSLCSARWMGGMDLFDEVRKRTIASAAGRFARCRNGARGERLK